MSVVRFVGGPWDERMLNSKVATAPSRIAPMPDRVGVYGCFDARHCEVFVYVWRQGASVEAGEAR
jgi:hypothetical protein